jgi:hypothetical protein
MWFVAEHRCKLEIGFNFEFGANMRAVFGAAFLLLTVVSSADARPIQCLLQVNGRTYIDRVCNGNFQKDGSFSLGTDERNSPYFAYVNSNDDGSAEGYWNGEAWSSHAHDSLGTLFRSGACWQNAKARICAWKIGENRWFAK